MSAFRNIWKIPELRSRIFFTLALILLCRLIAVVPTPGLNPAGVTELAEALRSNASRGGGLMGMADLFTGGALANCAVGTLSIWPYINASIIIQLMTAIIPSLEKMAREGDVGRQKLTQTTRYLTLVLCAGQAFGIAKLLEHSENLGIHTPLVAWGGFGFEILTVIAMTSATMLIMWLGEQITERGIGNGMSIIIMVNICARLPHALWQTAIKFTSQGGASPEYNPFTLLVLVVLAILVFAGTILLVDGVRKVPIHTARGSVGGRVVGGRSTYLPLRVNFGGVMPIIFAQPILAALGALFAFIRPEVTALGWLRRYGEALKTGYTDPSAAYLISYALLIAFFSSSASPTTSRAPTATCPASAPACRRRSSWT